ncbi:hypothetical protein AB0J38_17250 [Streptomyces sp. NPDC050095]|uniref:VG15 protein n=1 Tax=unclassified Streptomyces TaxID=2593676 RepID=UPI00342D90DB
MPQRERELARLLDEHRMAQARISATVSAQALAQWSRVSPTSLTSSSGAWLALMLSVIRRERAQSQAVAVSFYRLHRALETGYTLPPLTGDATAGAVTLGVLREDWAQHTDTAHVPAADGAVAVQVDDFDWPTPDTSAQDAAARTSLAVTGPVRAQRAIDQATERQERGRLDAADFLDELESVMDQAGTTAAASADRETLRGGRELIRDASQADTRVIGWARVTDDDPCAFCAMLASRGAVYRSRQIAGIRGRTRRNLRDVENPEDLQKYHDLCHCQTIPVYSETAFVPESSAQYEQDWRRVTRGLAGAEARRVWRQYIDTQRRGRRSS